MRAQITGRLWVKELRTIVRDIGHAIVVVVGITDVAFAVVIEIILLQVSLVDAVVFAVHQAVAVIVDIRRTTSADTSLRFSRVKGTAVRHAADLDIEYAIIVDIIIGIIAVVVAINMIIVLSIVDDIIIQSWSLLLS